jgi:NADH:ubiquinone oxidoreductase subunit 5 (subunit L)/multisubunit Na+/H+ antiporter MnhA subunit
MLSTSIAMFHLVVHACFKALLFLSAGSIIHSFNNEQDVRKMSGIDIYIPVTVMSLIVGSATMNGVFGLSGAISKDYILFVNFFGNSYMNFVGFGFLLLSIFFGALYAARICSFFFSKIYGGAKIVIKNVHESDFYILIPLIVLSFLSVYVGFFLENVFKDEFSSIWFGGKHIMYNNYALSFGEYNSSSVFFKNFGEILSDEEMCLLIENVAAFGTFFAIYIYKMKQVNIYTYKGMFYIRDYFYYFYNYTEKRSMTDRIYNKIFAFMEFRNAKVYFFDYFERGVLEVIGPKGITDGTMFLSRVSKRLTTGLVHNYLFFSLIFLLLIIILNFSGIFISVFFVIAFFVLIIK